MKTLLRSLGLMAALALTVFAMAGSAAGSGTCRTTCYNPTTRTNTFVVVLTSEAQCCSSSYNPCSPTTIKLVSTFSGGGSLMLCPP
jgi:hypothetical protein